MKTNRFKVMVGTGLLGLVLVLMLVGAMVMTSGQVVAAPGEAPLASTLWCGTNTYCVWTLQSGDGITASQASENIVRQGGSIVFNRAELYSTMDEGSAQTQTVKLQYSANGTTWLDHDSGGMTAQTADGSAAISLTSLSGIYWRAYITLGTTATTTPTIQFILKRNQ